MEEFSRASCSGGEPCAPLSVTAGITAAILSPSKAGTGPAPILPPVDPEPRRVTTS